MAWLGKVLMAPVYLTVGLFLFALGVGVVVAPFYGAEWVLKQLGLEQQASVCIVLAGAGAATVYMVWMCYGLGRGFWKDVMKSRSKSV